MSIYEYHGGCDSDRWIPSDNRNVLVPEKVMVLAEKSSAHFNVWWIPILLLTFLSVCDQDLAKNHFFGRVLISTSVGFLLIL